MTASGNGPVDRRGFMLGSLAGASAAALAGTKVAAAVDSSGAGTATATGDTVDGKRVVESLKVEDLEAGRMHRLHFRGVEMPSGQSWLVSVIVARGARPGKRVALVSGVHGDEMSSINTVHGVMNQLDPAMMSGSVLAVTDVSRPALEAMARRGPTRAADQASST